ncbi:uncharacterized protein LOC120104171 [Phoenix dactylifera]|uniref:Uncharacterized protein LOC120104171 n=1 Tax=Phoenix dactylifera TaxID=42345 RepID=A0A8B8Z9H0_PHODC|nr:uncharacterized protein LOC120104171 [Phoenix dactylifera]
MVFKHNKLPFTYVDPNQLAYEDLRQLDYDGQVASFEEISSSRGIPQKSLTSDGEREKVFTKTQATETQEDELRPGSDSSTFISVVTNKEYENRNADSANDTSESALGDTSSMSWVTGSTSEVIRSEHSKRPMCDNGAYQVENKRQKQTDPNKQLDSFAVIPFSSCKELPTSAAADRELENEEAAAVPKDPANKETSKQLPWIICSRSEEETNLDSGVSVHFFPSCFEEYQSANGFHQVEEMYSPLFDHPYRKLVAVGPNHQADIPQWRSREFKNSFGDSDDCVSVPLTSMTSSSVHHMIDEDDSNKWVGTCVMPMPDSDSLASEVRAVHCKTDCSCLDEGSIRCVRQHITEAREKLKRMLGKHRFEELGLYNMGEDATKKWTEEEEQLFQEVVLLNPASLCKNFWDHLYQVLPSRSSKELISYYYNVFMLRKRAEQNRLDPLNVDSDNDEWQESDDGEFATMEENEEDSVVSLANQGDLACNKDGPEETDISEDIDDEDECDDYTIADNNEEALCGVSEGCISNKSIFCPTAQLIDKKLQNGVEQDVRGDSCMSYEGQHNGADSGGGAADNLDTQHSLIKDHDHLLEEFGNDGGISVVTDHGFFDDHCDPKTWDMNYTHGAENDDFLSTYNVIEEVFGKGAWENDAKGNHGVIQS